MAKGLMRKLVVVFVFMMIGGAVLAQFNDTVNYHLRAAATGNLNHTNTGSTSIFNNSFGFDINKKRFSLNSSAGYIYGKNPTQKTNDDFLGVMNFDYLYSVQKLYYWGLAAYEKSYSLKINDRFQTGGGVGYTFLRKPEALLVVSNGLLFETTDLKQMDQYGRKSYQTLRNSFRVKFRFSIKGDLVIFEGTEFVQNSFNEGQDYILKLNNNVSVKIYKWLSLTAAFNYNRMNAIGTENLFLSYGLAFDRYF